MATKRYRKSNKSKELTYEDIKGLNLTDLSSDGLQKYFLGGVVDETNTNISTKNPLAESANSESTLNNASQKSGMGAQVGSIPIVGMFAKAGTAIGGAFTQRDEHGIAQSSKGAQAIGNFVDPITVAQDFAKEGKWGKAALSTLIPGAASIMGKKLNDKKKAELAKQEAEQRAYDKEMQQFQESYTTIPTYSGVMRNGGTLNYGGQLHEGPNGGVPVDGMGNPNSTNPVALVEKGEVSYNTPDGGTYIYSDTLKHDKNKTFAKKAKDIQRRYKFRMKDGVINDPFAKKTYDAEMLQLQDNQEELKNFQNMQKESLEIKKNGGNLPLYFGPNFTNNWSMKLPKQNTNPDFSINTKMLPFDQYAFGYNKFPNTFVGNKSTTSKQQPKSNTDLYQGMNWAQTGLAAAGPILGGITGLVLNNKRKAPVNLKLSRMTPQQINLERERAAARESAGVATSNLSRALKGVSPTAGSYMSNVVAGITDIDRNLSNALGESYTQEELQNAQLRQQAETANLDIDMQEQMYNSQLRNQFDASKEAARNAYINQITGGITGGLSQKFQSEQNADYLNMLNPDYVMVVTGKGLRRRKMIVPRTQIGG